ncbi:sensor protein [Caulobacter sp. B11]|uniref:sensor histidine kinase n=1 Tax=Caulobacter sp. B11 TaxID=2048899 RepID=UPI000C12B9DD|nr:HAMP domain-containing sensor histidine kinase [Caulobacter sp. B11]PHY13510.1 sensor protein [Caulobacter sp. B11]
MKGAIWTSFRARLIVGAIIWITAGLAVSGWALAELFRAHVTEQFDEELQGHASELAVLAAIDETGKPYLHRRLSDPRFLPVGSGFYWQLQAPDGRWVSSASLEGRRLPLGAPFAPLGVEQHRFVEGPNGHIRLVETSVRPVGASAPLRIGIGVEQRLLDQVLARFNWTLAASLLFIALGLSSAALLQIWFGLRPLGRVRDALAAVRTGRAQRLPDDLPSEVAPLAADLNNLLEANLDMLRRARTQAGNLGHALKTPMAILVDEAARLRSSGNTSVAEVIEQQCERMHRQIDYQLARARAAALRSAPGVATRVDDALEPVLQAMARLHSRRGVEFKASVAPDLTAALDAQDLAEILANLLDNGGKWARSRVEIIAQSPDGGNILITVDDDGPGLAPEAYEVVFGLGERLDEQMPGHGMGLAIVKDLIVLYGGKIWLGASPLGGLRVHLHLPAIV